MTIQQHDQINEKKKKVFTYNTISGLKIGSAVGIIILLLGITIFFGIHQMSMVNQEVLKISQKYSPLNGMINEIKYQQQIQAISLEKTIRYNLVQNEADSIKAKEQFWLSSGVIDAKIASAQKITESQIVFSNNDFIESEFSVLQQEISEIEKIHLDYEDLANKLFLIPNELELEKKIIIEKIQKNELELHSKLDNISSNISILTQNSIGQIEENESTTLWGQFFIIIIVGVIAALLVLFLNQINTELANEVKIKTIDLQNANEKLKELDRMKDEFIGIASHELRSPIQPIFGFAELAKSGDIGQDEAWSGVTQLAKKLQNLANDVLDVSRIDSERLILHKEPVRINDLIKESVNEVKNNLDKEFQIQMILDKNVQINLDKIRFEQVLRNLLSNSIKFTPKGIIKIYTNVNEDKNTLHVIVSDSGEGIPNEMIHKIFDKFVTLGGSKLNQSGTGLGLFLCKGIIEAHGGKIFARNNHDKGATFEFTVPIIDRIEKNELITNNI